MDTDFAMLLQGRPRYTAWGEQLGNPLRNVFMTAAVNALAGRIDRPLRILEVGSWVGASAATWSEALTRFHPPGGTIACVDPWSGYDVQNDFHRSDFLQRYRHALETDYAFRLFSYNVSLLPHRVVAMRGRSTEVLPQLRDGGFDLVYIDGDHAYDSCRFDIQEGMRLTAEGGILCGDDLDLTLAETDAAFVRQNRDKQPAKDPASGRVFHPGVTLAVAECVPQAVNLSGFWAVQRSDGGFRPFEVAGMDGFLPGFFDDRTREAVMRVLRESGMAGKAG